MVKSIPESGEKLFLRVLKYSIVRSLPFAALPLICAPILSAGGYSHAKYLGGFLVCCILSVACAAGANVYFIYRSFPRANDKKSGCICHALMLSAFISTLVAIAASFGGGAIFGAITKTGHAGAFLLILNNTFTAAFLLFSHLLFLGVVLYCFREFFACEALLWITINYWILPPI